MSDTTPPVPPAPPTPEGIVPPQPNPYAQSNSYVQANPGAQPNAYAQPTPYAQPYAYAAQPYASGQYARATNTLAIVALVLAFVVPLGGIICGHIALGQIRRTGEGGHGLALAGTVLGYVFVALGFVIFVIYVALFATAFSNGGYSSYSG